MFISVLCSVYFLYFALISVTIFHLFLFQIFLYLFQFFALIYYLFSFILVLKCFKCKAL